MWGSILAASAVNGMSNPPKISVPVPATPVFGQQIGLEKASEKDLINFKKAEAKTRFEDKDNLDINSDEDPYSSDEDHKNGTYKRLAKSYNLQIIGYDMLKAPNGTQKVYPIVQMDDSPYRVFLPVPNIKEYGFTTNFYKKPNECFPKSEQGKCSVNLPETEGKIIPVMKKLTNIYFPPKESNMGNAMK